MLIQRIEEAALNAWPARQQLFLDGWILRFSEGYTKRANSITPLYPAALDMEQKIRLCEQLYPAQGLPPIFRVTSLADSTQLDQRLGRRGYTILDRTWVLGLDLADWHAVTSQAMKEVSLEDWLGSFHNLHGGEAENLPGHRAILQRILFPHLRAVAFLDGEPVCCGLGVLDGECFGIFDLITSPNQRGKGFATRLMQDMLNWGVHSGARYAYLQVVENNIPARRLYQRLGFQEVYPYWYRLPG